MRYFDDMLPGEPLECPADAGGGAWVLLGRGQLPEGSCFIADAPGAEVARVVGYFDGESGDVFACSEDGAVDRSAPAVHMLGSSADASGQLTVRQEKGNYLRICNWDKLGASIAQQTGAQLRTLPQCGCGGSLGAPKLFGSFAHMCAYHFCAFYL